MDKVTKFHVLRKKLTQNADFCTKQSPVGPHCHVCSISHAYAFFFASPTIRHPPFLFLSFSFFTFLFIYYYLLSVIFIVQIIYRTIICRYGILLTFSAIPTPGIHTKPPPFIPLSFSSRSRFSYFSSSPSCVQIVRLIVDNAILHVGSYFFSLIFLSGIFVC